MNYLLVPAVSLMGRLRFKYKFVVPALAGGALLLWLGFSTISQLNDRVRMAQALRMFRPHVVIHLASALRDETPTNLGRTNVEGTRTLLEAIADSGVDLRRLIVGSTGGVYGAIGDARLPFDETAPCRPADPYSASKLAAEQVSRLLSGEFHLQLVERLELLGFKFVTVDLAGFRSGSLNSLVGLGGLSSEA